MDKMRMMKDRILQEMMDDMDDHESSKIQPKEISITAVGADKSPLEEDFGNPSKMNTGGMGSSDLPGLGNDEDEDDEDDDDLKKLMDEYSRA